MQSLVNCQNELRSGYEDLMLSDLEPVLNIFFGLFPSNADISVFHKYTKNKPSAKLSNELIVLNYNIDITREKFFCLAPQTWLNDEIINFHMGMLIEDINKKPINERTSIVMNTFFYERLMDEKETGSFTYKNVVRWTIKFENVLTKDLIVIPINQNNTHWVLVVVYPMEKRIVYYDSMYKTQGIGQNYLKNVLRWLSLEAIGSKKYNKPSAPGNFDQSEWSLIDGCIGVPQQGNGFDCGVYVIFFARLIMYDLPLFLLENEKDLNSLMFRQTLGVAIINSSGMENKDVQTINNSRSVLVGALDSTGIIDLTGTDSDDEENNNMV